jgi:hypothetical protein
MPNIRRARASTLSTHPDSRSRGEGSAMCGGSIRCVAVTGPKFSNRVPHIGAELSVVVVSYKLTNGAAHGSCVLTVL